ncbi:glycoside hydrolase family 78 protein [Lutibacter sp. A64]|uniref:alpha-L-rhamnosidase n=1 Tax=Lutibacter sp. A64 TaxID=2918526 RepID=UPI001F05248A|nr:alpha-L-rhamnosidase [Lutibacter sp. A64]UMB54116.1 glycoside hydrolase family 78 protein [Lutibacter sp. A64]
MKKTGRLKVKIGFSIIALLLLNISCAINSSKDQTDLSFEALTCNSQKNPIAIESEQPLLSWVVKAEGYNREQTAYQVLVASNLENLNEDDADMWNSNKVSSSQSIHNKYLGSKLLSTQIYYWKVRIWDEKGVVSSWSTVNTFEMGLLEEANWNNAKWITLNKDTRTSEHRFREYKTGKMDEPLMVESFAASYFRNSMNVEKEVVNAQAYICGLGYYELYLNGKKVGDHVLDPAPSNYDKQAYYVKYDITKQLKSGENAVGIILGNGFYGQDVSWKRDPESERDLAYGAPSVRLLVKVKYSDGSESDFYTNDTWRETTGPIVFNNIYGGDTYDARYEINGWNTVGYNDEKWGQAKEVSPKLKKVSAQQIPAIKKLKILEPQNVFKGTTGNWIVDFGQNIAGWVQIQVEEKEGQLIEITTTEALTQDGKNIYAGSTGGGANGMRQVYKYICKGEGVEAWEPKFSYHGFRYAEIKGVSSKPDAAMIKAVLVATDIQEKGSFTSSDALLNKMHSISKWTIVDNVHGIPEDCPHREKCGWLGDAHAFCEYAQYNYDMKNFYKKFMEDIRTQMRPTAGHNNPKVKFQVPTMIAPGKRTSTYAKLDWGVATMYLPWYNYLYYGDAAIVKEYYQDMKGLTDFYLSFKGENGIIQDGMGDWCPPNWDRRRNPSAMECDPIISANAYFYDILGIMEKFAKMNNDTAYEMQLKKEKQSLKDAFNKEFLTTISTTNHKWYGSQTATVMALQFGMVQEAEKESVVNGLAHDIVEVKGGHHATGIHGNRYIYTILTKYGKGDLAYEILTTPDFPSQTYVMNYGFTTWPERQFEWEKMDGLSNSLNHPMHSGFAAYFFESLGGIKATFSGAGFKEFMVNPKFPKQITKTSVDVPTPYGIIHNSWEQEDSNFSMNLEVPFNTKARLYLTQSEFKSLKINGEAFSAFQKENKKEWDGDSSVILGSGSYSIKYIKL